MVGLFVAKMTNFSFYCVKITILIKKPTTLSLPRT